jgi:hypothetical protein
MKMQDPLWTKKMSVYEVAHRLFHKQYRYMTKLEMLKILLSITEKGTKVGEMNSLLECIERKAPPHKTFKSLRS